MHEGLIHVRLQNLINFYSAQLLGRQQMAL